MNIAVIGGGLSSLAVTTLLGRFDINTTTIASGFNGRLAAVNVDNPYGGGQFRFDLAMNAIPKNSAFHRLIEGLPGLMEHEVKSYYMEMEDSTKAIWREYPDAIFEGKLADGTIVMPEVDEIPPYYDQLFSELAISLFGQPFYEVWFRPFYERLLSAPLKSCDSDWIFSQMAAAAKFKELNPDQPETMVYVPSGEIIQSMLGSIIEHSGEGWTWVNAVAKSYYLEDDKWFIFGETGGSRLTLGPFDAIINTDSLSDFVADLGLAPEARENPLVLNNIISCGVMLPELYGGPNFTWLHPDVRLRAHQVSMPSRLHPDMAPDGHDSLLIEFPTENVLDRNLMDSFQYEVGIILSQLGVESNEMVWNSTRGYPAPYYGIRSGVARLKSNLAETGLYTIGNYGSQVTANNDQILGEALRCVNYMLSDEEEHDYLWSTDVFPHYAGDEYAIDD